MAAGLRLPRVHHRRNVWQGTRGRSTAALSTALVLGVCTGAYVAVGFVPSPLRMPSRRTERTGHVGDSAALAIPAAVATAFGGPPARAADDVASPVELSVRFPKEAIG